MMMMIMYIFYMMMMTTTLMTCLSNQKYTCVAGAYDRHKHTSILDSAQHELSEEAHLKGGQWIDLSPKEQPLGISEMKWGTNRFVPFLCIDPIVDEQPLERDAEEYMEVVKDVSIADIKRFVTQGQVMLPSVQTIWMALEYLTENSLL